MTGSSTVVRLVCGLARRIEKRAARAQGKGYGTATIARENALVLRLLGRTPQLAVDIGGNVGDYTAELRRRHPQVEIHVFEPSSTNIARLRERFAADERVTLVPCAVSDEARQAMLFADESGSGMGSLAQRDLSHRGLRFEAQESVSVIRFEDYWQQRLAGCPHGHREDRYRGARVGCLAGVRRGAGCDVGAAIRVRRLQHRYAQLFPRLLDPIPKAWIHPLPHHAVRPRPHRALPRE